jgi:hypothetical protein
MTCRIAVSGGARRRAGRRSCQNATGWVLGRELEDSSMGTGTHARDGREWPLWVCFVLFYKYLYAVAWRSERRWDGWMDGWMDLQRDRCAYIHTRSGDST